MKRFRLIFFSICLFLSSFLQAHPIDSIAEKYRNWILGSENIDYSNSLISERYNSIISLAKKSLSGYEKKISSMTDVRFDFLNNKNSSTSEFKRLVPETLYPLTMAYMLKGNDKKQNPYYHNQDILKKILYIYDKLHKKGWDAGLPLDINIKSYKENGYIALGGSIALSYLTYGVCTFLLSDELKNNGTLSRELDMLHWITRYVGPEFDNPIVWKESGFNSDVICSLMNTKLCYILSLPSNHPDREAEMLYFQRFLNNALEIAPGFSDVIKPDYVGYHHKNMYANAYAVNCFHVVAIYLYLLDGTPYAANSESIENISKAILTNRIYAQKYDIPRSISGRFPTHLSTLIQNIPAFAYMASIHNNPYKEKLEAAFMRLWEPEYEIFHSEFVKDVATRITFIASMGAIELAVNFSNKSIEPEKDPNGYWFFPYGGLTIYRQDKWMVSWRGTSKYIWDFEGPMKKNNEYGRYNGAGVLQIYASGNPVSSLSSGYGIKGWNWSSLPGTTTLYMPYNELPSKRHRQYSPSSFLGGTRLDDNCGVSSFSYIDNLSTLKANKSVFFFDDYIYVIGTDINCSGEKYPVQTTVAQLSVNDTVSKPLFKDKQYVDPYGHAYYFVESEGITVERKLQSEPMESNRGMAEGYYEICKINHGLNPTCASYAYVIKISGGKNGASEISANYSNMFETIQSDKIAHIVSYKLQNKKGYAIREGNSILKDKDIIKVSTPCIIALHNLKKQCKIAVSNPDMNRIEGHVDYNKASDIKNGFAKSKPAPVVVTIKGKWVLKQDRKDVHILSFDGMNTTICFDCIDARTIETELTRG